MATYKVLQDIEAEDKLLGPLTLRQCIYAAIAVLAGYLSFLAISKHASFLVIFFLPFMIFGGFFAFPWSRQQPTEVWALAKLRFMLKPRKRIWNQSGIKELVSITVPKQLEHIYSNGLSQTEVRSRLRALADTIDTRGWAVKNVDVDSFATIYSDRLVDASALPHEVPVLDDLTAIDMLDPDSSPVSRQFDSLLSASSDARREKNKETVDQSVLPAPTGAPDYWFMSRPDNSGSAADNVVDAVGPASMATTLPVAAPNGATTTNDHPVKAKDRKTKKSATPYSHFRNIPSLKTKSAKPVRTKQPPVTTAPTPATLELANNNDLNVATIAREAERRNPEPPEEVTVSLH